MKSGVVIEPVALALPLECQLRPNYNLWAEETHMTWRSGYLGEPHASLCCSPKITFSRPVYPRATIRGETFYRNYRRLFDSVLVTKTLPLDTSDSPPQISGILVHLSVNRICHSIIQVMRTNDQNNVYHQDSRNPCFTQNPLLQVSPYICTPTSAFIRTPKNYVPGTAVHISA